MPASLEALKSGFANGNLPTMTLTAAQEIAVIYASRPLQPQERAAFLDELKARLANRSEVGDGELFRAMRELQRKHLKPPERTAWS